MEIKLMASAAVLHKNKLLVMRRSAGEKFLSGYWTVVGGKFEDADGTIENAVRREVREEAGFDISVVKPINVEEFTREDKPGMMAVEITYLCTPYEDADVVLSAEHDAYQWIGASDADTLAPVTDLTRKKIKRIFTAIRG